jgi:hypothetical protein
LNRTVFATDDVEIDITANHVNSRTDNAITCFMISLGIPSALKRHLHEEVTCDEF